MQRSNASKIIEVKKGFKKIKGLNKK